VKHVTPLRIFHITVIHKKVPLKLMTMVGAYNEEKAEEVRGIFKKAGVKLGVEVKPEWYF
jgi:hypothetical protein